MRRVARPRLTRRNVDLSSSIILLLRSVSFFPRTTFKKDFQTSFEVKRAMVVVVNSFCMRYCEFVLFVVKKGWEAANS